MLGNNEKIEHVDYGDLFTRMVRELPWSNLRVYIQSNAALLKMCTFGGHRVEPQKRDRLEKIVCREAARSEYSEAMCNGVFASWYPVHEELHRTLEDYFHSEEYSAYRRENHLNDEDYVLPQEKFTELFQLSDLLFWKLLLCFSPLRFSEEQGRQILDSTAGNDELLEQIEKLQAEAEELRRKNTQLQNENEKLHARQQNDASEIQDLKKQNRNMKSESDALNRKYESSQAEVRRLNQRLDNSSSDVEDQMNRVKEETERQVARVQGEFERVSRELASWQSKYEEQRLANRSYEDKASAAERMARDVRHDADVALAKADENVRKMNAVLQEREKFVDLFLSRVDWSQIGAAMKLSPTMRRNFNSLIKKLNYEEDMSLTLEGTLVDFWQKLTDAETALVTEVANSNALESMEGDLGGFWKKLESGFGIVESNLEAKIVLLGILRGIFYQDIEDEDLEQPTVPAVKKAK